MRRGVPRRGRLVRPALLVGLLLVPVSALASVAFARFMRTRALGQQIRIFGPVSHAVKAGTPTMGGLVVFALWLAGIGVLAFWHRPDDATGFVLATAALCAAIGAADDIISLRRKRSTGLSGPAKLALTSVAAGVVFIAFRDVLLVPVRIPFASTDLHLPTMATLLLVWFVLLSTTNGMNLTDGLDGLAAGVAAIVLAGLILLRPTASNLALIVPLIGSLVGFLWINVHPAGLFLGDTGSFFLGGAIASIALVNGLGLLLPILAGVLVLEAGSVILQTGSVRATGKRIFRMSPLHHHFEHSDDPKRQHLLPAFHWDESQVTVRFWILAGFFVGLAVLADRI